MCIENCSPAFPLYWSSDFFQVDPSQLRRLSHELEKCLAKSTPSRELRLYKYVLTERMDDDLLGKRVYCLELRAVEIVWFT